jgi:valyl-tRNA synthetase
LGVSAARLSPDGGALRATARFDLRIAHSETADVPAELARLRKERERLARDIESKQSRLGDETFRSRAPAEVVRQMETTLSERRLALDKILARLAQIDPGTGAAAAE